MRKGITKRWKQVVSLILVVACVFTTVRVNGIMANAEENITYPANVPSTKLVASSDKDSDYSKTFIVEDNITAEDVVASNVCQGLSLKFAQNSMYQGFRTRNWIEAQLKDGFKIELRDFAEDGTPDGTYSIAIGLGRGGNGNYQYNQRGYYFIIGCDGGFAIVRTDGNHFGKDNVTKVAKGTLNKTLTELDELSLYVKAITGEDGHVDWIWRLNDGDASGTIKDVFDGTYAYGSSSWTKVEHAQTCQLRLSVFSEFESTEDDYLSGLGGVWDSTGKDGGKRSNALSVTISELYMNGYVAVESFEMEQAETFVKPGETVSLNAVAKPANATETVTSMKWESSDSTVATVDESGKVTGEAKGTAWITATATNGMKAYCVVNVDDEITYPANVPSTKDSNIVLSKALTVSDVMESGVCQGMKVTWPKALTYSNSISMAKDVNGNEATVNIGNGFVIEVKELDKTACADYSLLFGFGYPNNWTGGFDVNTYGYMFVVDQDGTYAVVKVQGKDDIRQMPKVTSGKLSKSLKELGKVTLYIKAVTDADENIDYEWTINDTLASGTIENVYDKTTNSAFGLTMYNNPWYGSNPRFKMRIGTGFTPTDEVCLNGLKYGDGNSLDADLDMVISKYAYSGAYTPARPLSVGSNLTTTTEETISLGVGETLPTGYVGTDKYIVGWKDADGNAATVAEAGKQYTADFMDTDSLHIGVQKSNTVNNVWRLIASVEGLEGYKNVGFVVSKMNPNPAVGAPDCQTVASKGFYSGVKYTENEAVQTALVGDLYKDSASTRLFLQAVHVKNTTGNLYVRAYVELNDGTIVYGNVGNLGSQW